MKKGQKIVEGIEDIPLEKREDWKRFWEDHHSVKYLRDMDRSKAEIRLMIADEALKVGTSILDAGCITGIDYPICTAKGLKYSGVDITPKFISYAKKLYPEADVRVGDILELPFPDTSFDTAYCKDVLENLPPNEWKTAIRELWRVSRKLIMIAFCEPPWDKPTLRSIVIRGEGFAWVNYYNKTEFVEFLKGLPIFKSLEIREPIKSLTGRDLALYIVMKND